MTDRVKKFLPLILLVSLILVSALPSPSRAFLFSNDVEDIEEELLEDLQDLDDYVKNSWWVRMGKYRRMLRDLEENIQKLGQKKDKNVSFFLAANNFLQEHRMAYNAWRRAKRSEDTSEDYNISLRNGYWQRAALVLDRAESLLF